VSYHPRVRHPRTLVPEVGSVNGWVTRVATSALGSMAVFWVTFLIPLVSIPASDTVKLLVSIVLSSWFQAWALPILQRSANTADIARQAKADTDHDALTHIATQVDAILAAAVLAATPVTPSPRKRSTDA
jgi:Co/Zn/Cd efflux system component